MAELIDFGVRIRQQGAEGVMAAVQRTESAFGRLWSRVIGLNQALELGGRIWHGTVAPLVAQADAARLIEGRLRNVVSSEEELARVQEDLFQVAQRGRAGFEDTAALYTRLGLATKDLGTSQQDLLDVTESVAKALVVSGASAAETSSAGPRILQAIAEEMGVKSIGDLKKLGEQGKITADVILNSMLNALGKINEEFSNLPMTVGAAMTLASNQTFRLISQFDEMSGASNKLADTINRVADELGDWMTANDELIASGVHEFFKGLTFTIERIPRALEMAATAGGKFLSVVGPVFDWITENPEMAAGLFGAYKGATLAARLPVPLPARPYVIAGGAALGGLAGAYAGHELGRDPAEEYTQSIVRQRFEREVAQGMLPQTPAEIGYSDVTYNATRQQQRLNEQFASRGRTGLPEYPTAAQVYEMRERRWQQLEAEVAGNIARDRAELRTDLERGDIVGGMTAAPSLFDQTTAAEQSALSAQQGRYIARAGRRATARDTAATEAEQKAQAAVAKEAADAAKRQQEELDNLVNTLLERAAPAAQRFGRELDTYVVAMGTGRVSTETYANAVTQLADQYGGSIQNGEQFTQRVSELSDQYRSGQIDAGAYTSSVREIADAYLAQADASQVLLRAEEVRRQEQQAMRDEAAGFIESARPELAVERTLRRVSALEAGGFLAPDQRREIVDSIVDDFERIGDSGDRAFQRLTEATEQFGRTFTRQLAEAFTGAKLNFEELLRGFATDLLELSIYETATRPIFEAVRLQLDPEARRRKEQQDLRIQQGESMRQAYGGTSRFAEPAGEAAGLFAGGAVGMLARDDTRRGPIEGMQQYGGDVARETVAAADDVESRWTQIADSVGEGFDRVIGGVGDGFMALVQSVSGAFGSILTGLFAGQGGGGFWEGLGMAVLGGAVQGAAGAAFSGGGSPMSQREQLDFAASEYGMTFRYHDGGVIGATGPGRSELIERTEKLAAGERIIVAQDGELVLPRAVTSQLVSRDRSSVATERNVLREIDRVAGVSRPQESGALPSLPRYHDGGLVGGLSLSSSSSGAGAMAGESPSLPSRPPARPRATGPSRQTEQVQQTHVTVPVTIQTTSLDPRGAAGVIAEHLPMIEGHIRRSIERGRDLAIAVGRRRG